MFDQPSNHLFGKPVLFDRVVSAENEHVVGVAGVFTGYVSRPHRIHDRFNGPKHGSEQPLPLLAQHDLMQTEFSHAYPVLFRSFSVRWTHPCRQLTRMVVKHGRHLKAAHGPQQAKLPAEGPIRRSVNVHDVGSLIGRGASPLQFRLRPSVGSPFRPNVPGRMRGEQVGFPAVGRMLGQGVHDRRHATRRVARTNMEHLAHERAKGFGVKKPPENAGVRLEN